MGICPYSFFDERAIKILKKYLYCKKWGILPFESYEKTPKWWIDAEGIIEDELSILSKKPKGGDKPDGTPKRS